MNLTEKEILEYIRKHPNADKNAIYSYFCKRYNETCFGNLDHVLSELTRVGKLKKVIIEMYSLEGE